MPVGNNNIPETEKSLKFKIDFDEETQSYLHFLIQDSIAWPKLYVLPMKILVRLERI